MRLLAGALGIISFDMSVNQQYVLLPVFIGLFAVPAIIRTIGQRESVPEHHESEISAETAAPGGVLGFMDGVIAGIFPGLGSAASTFSLTGFRGLLILFTASAIGYSSILFFSGVGTFI